ncbi:MAG TPA: S1C family serine protease [Kofleriaceae bacterium]|jgi:S1-C subfamily serine protease
MAKRAAPVVTTTVCPQCHVAGPVRLAPGRMCAACETQGAWARVGDGGPLVIDRDVIAEAEQRRAGEAAGERWWRRALPWLPRVATFALAAVAAWCVVLQFSARPIAPLGQLLAELAAANKHTAIAGGVALVAAIVMLLRLRKHRHFRKLPLVLGHALALCVGAAALVIGLVGWLGTGSFGGRYTSMPAREQLGMPSHVQRVLDATVVVLAPGADGDARELALGTGAVIARDETRAWIVTCSHVAIPYAAVGTFRDAAHAQPVWVQLSDGREGLARVRWVAPPPVDVVVIELPIDHPPEPVPIASSSDELKQGSPVLFVPLPYRSGWQVLHGSLERRETHHTPAGAYDLLYTDLPVIPGDSGSGLYDEHGDLVGLNTWTRAEDGRAEGISLPSETMSGLVDQIRAGTLVQE